MEEVTFRPCWLQSRVSSPCQEHRRRMWRRWKTCCCWLLLLNVWFEHIWIEEVNYWSMEANLWCLNIKIVSSILDMSLSNQIFAELRRIVLYVESDLDNFSMQHPDCYVCFSFLRTCTDDCFVWMLVLLPIAFWGLKKVDTLDQSLFTITKKTPTPCPRIE